jgi:hypothetical protein
VLSAPVIAALSGQAQAMARTGPACARTCASTATRSAAGAGWHRHLTLAMIAQSAVELSRRPAADQVAPQPAPLEGRWAV